MYHPNAQPSHIPSLPEELLDLIVHELVPHSELEYTQQLALGSCILASRSLRHHALIKLFKHVRILTEDPEKSKRRMSLLREIVTPPMGSALESVVPHIKELSCFLTEKIEYWPGSSVYARCETLIGDGDLGIILRNVHGKDFGIVCLSIESFSTYCLGIRWSELASSLQGSLQSIIQSPNLRSLEIKGLKSLPATLLAGTHVKDLRLQKISYNAGKIPSARTYIPKNALLDCPPIESLYTDNPYQFADPRMSFASLKQLEVRIDDAVPNHHNETWNIVKASAKTLEHLRIDDYCKLKLLSDFGIDHIPNLKTFTHFHHRGKKRPYYPGHDSNMRVIHRLLDVRAPMKMLTRLDLQFKFNEVDVMEDFLFPDREPLWKGLDEILFGPQYPALKYIKIIIEADITVLTRDDCFDPDTFTRKTTDTLLNVCFPRARDSIEKVLRVEITAKEIYNRGLIGRKQARCK